ncbi:AsmA-like C-terminal region-containing protein [Methylobacterium sp. ID0610]|uniref:AsmA-like C-terminal region-containing protein n=1 Tax=Methylobacterium carpenticola TaxID=3344827 RepID=UPI00367DE4A2
MRDILTALAGLVILVLAAALVVPPFVNWEGQRAAVDAALARSLGVPVRSDGRLEIRLLPSPRLRVDHFVLGGGGRPALDARFVKAEIALTPLLSGEIRFTETRIGRAEVTVPVTEGGAPVVPPELSTALGGRDLAVEDLQVAQLLFTTLVPATGRTDQFYAESVRLAAPRLAGPWRIEGQAGPLPFRLATGAPSADGVVPVKVTAGGDTAPRIEIDARLGLAGDPSRGLVPEATGTARLVVGPPAQAAGPMLPFSLQGAFKARGRVATFDGLALEIDGGGAPLRLTGRGTLDLPGLKAALSLDARRLDLDAFLAGPSGQALLARGFSAFGPPLPGTVAIDLAVESATIGLGEWTGLSAAAILRPSGALALRRLAATAPGGVQLALDGDLAGPGSFAGRLAVKAAASDRLARLLDRFGFGSPLLRLLDGRAFEAAADVTAALPVLSLRNARVTLGEARLTGSARYSPATGDAGRPRLDAQLVADGLDLAELPPLRGLFETLRDHDLGLTLQARDLRYGAGGPRTGEIAASLQSEGPALRVDSLEVKGLAGAQASLSGRIAADGSGRIAGRVTAPKAAPLVDLLERTLVAEASAVPRFLRDGSLVLDVTLERDPGAVETGRLRSHARGEAAGGRLGLSLVTLGGRLDSLDARLDRIPSGLWLGRPQDPALAMPAALSLAGRRADAGAPLAMTLMGDLAGARITTARPLLLDDAAALPREGEIGIDSPDLRPLAGFLGRSAIPPAAVPARLTLALGREGERPRVALDGSVLGSPVAATLVRGEDGVVSGSARLDQLSLPWLAAALMLDAPAASAATWPASRFGPAPATGLRGSLATTVRRLDLGRGLVAEGARFDLGLGPEGLSLRQFDGALAGGRLAGSATLARQGGQATLSGEVLLTDLAIPALTGGEAVRGRLSGRLRVGAAGDSTAALVGNLAGSGEIRLADLALREIDPAGVERALGRLLAEEDPLRTGRVEQVVSEEFGRGMLRIPGPLAVPAAVVGGVLRTSTLALDLGPSSWSGLIQVDLRALRLDARGILTAGRTPRGWTAPAPTLALALVGPVANPVRETDVTPLTTALAAVVLQRELDKIELIEADRNELSRRRSRLEMDRFRAGAEAEWARRQAEEKVRAEAAARAEAARAAEEARRRTEEETARRRAEEALRKAEEDAARARETHPAQTSQPAD